uniref:Asparagine synthetase domain-containing protein 1 n=1 Tax=Neospora caninum (strain Liverpool) TaxID=572307 RepID=A0A0F7UGV7_NEOCL|nr:TPA: Asparagine synthetase domain-containing protein 1 [Neospora caninum Liverpool]
MAAPFVVTLRARGSRSDWVCSSPPPSSPSSPSSPSLSSPSPSSPPPSSPSPSSSGCDVKRQVRHAGALASAACLPSSLSLHFHSDSIWICGPQSSPSSPSCCGERAVQAEDSSRRRRGEVRGAARREGESRGERREEKEEELPDSRSATCTVRRAPSSSLVLNLARPAASASGDDVCGAARPQRQKVERTDAQTPFGGKEGSVRPGVAPRGQDLGEDHDSAWKNVDADRAQILREDGQNVRDTEGHEGAGDSDVPSVLVWDGDVFGFSFARRKATPEQRPNHMAQLAVQGGIPEEAVDGADADHASLDGEAIFTSLLFALHTKCTRDEDVLRTLESLTACSTRGAENREREEAGNAGHGDATDKTDKGRDDTDHRQVPLWNNTRGAFQARFALVFFSASLRKLYFCRDKIGTRSLICCTSLSASLFMSPLSSSSSSSSSSSPSSSFSLHPNARSLRSGREESGGRGVEVRGSCPSRRIEEPVAILLSLSSSTCDACHLWKDEGEDVEGAAGVGARVERSLERPAQASGLALPPGRASSPSHVSSSPSSSSQCLSSGRGTASLDWSSPVSASLGCASEDLTAPSEASPSSRYFTRCEEVPVDGLRELSVDLFFSLLHGFGTKQGEEGGRRAAAQDGRQALNLCDVAAGAEARSSSSSPSSSSSSSSSCSSLSTISSAFPAACSSPRRDDEAEPEDESEPFLACLSRSGLASSLSYRPWSQAPPLASAHFWCRIPDCAVCRRGSVSRAGRRGGSRHEGKSDRAEGPDEASGVPANRILSREARAVADALLDELAEAVLRSCAPLGRLARGRDVDPERGTTHTSQPHGDWAWRERCPRNGEEEKRKARTRKVHGNLQEEEAFAGAAGCGRERDAPAGNLRNMSGKDRSRVGGEPHAGWRQALDEGGEPETEKAETGQEREAEHWPDGDGVAILFSGGVDSSLLAALVLRLVAEGRIAPRLSQKKGCETPRKEGERRAKRNEEGRLQGNATQREGEREEREEEEREEEEREEGERVEGTEETKDTGRVAGGGKKFVVELVNVAFTPTAPDRLTGLASFADLLRKLERLRSCEAAVGEGREKFEIDLRFVCVDVAEQDAVEAEKTVLRLVAPHATHMDVNIASALYFAARGRGYLVSPSFQAHPEWERLLASAVWEDLQLRCSPLPKRSSGRGSGPTGPSPEPPASASAALSPPGSSPGGCSVVACPFCHMKAKAGCAHNACRLCCLKLLKVARGELTAKPKAENGEVSERDTEARRKLYLGQRGWIVLPPATILYTECGVHRDRFRNGEATEIGGDAQTASERDLPRTRLQRDTVEETECDRNDEGGTACNELQPSGSDAQSSTCAKAGTKRAPSPSPSEGPLPWYAASSGDGRIARVFPHDSPRTAYAVQSRVVLLGSGADELFGGYGRHKTARLKRGTEAVRAEMLLDLRRLWSRNLGRDGRVFSHFSRVPRLPFLDVAFLDFVNSAIPFESILSPPPASLADAPRVQETAPLERLHDDGTTTRTPFPASPSPSPSPLSASQSASSSNSSPDSPASPPSSSPLSSSGSLSSVSRALGHAVLSQLAADPAWRTNKWVLRICALHEEMRFAAFTKKRAIQFGTRAAQLSNRRCALSNRQAKGTALFRETPKE